MSIRKLLIISLILSILSCVMIVLLSLISLVAFSLILSAMALVGESVPGWFSIALLLSVIVAVVAVVGASIAFKFKQTGFGILVATAILSLILPISFWAVVDFQLSAIVFILILLIPTILLVVAMILNLKVIKKIKNENTNKKVEENL